MPGVFTETPRRWLISWLHGHRQLLETGQFLGHACGGYAAAVVWCNGPYPDAAVAGAAAETTAVLAACGIERNVGNTPSHKFTKLAMKKLLLIDDDERLARPLRSFLQQHDFQLSNKTDPLQGLESLKTGDYDLVILDVMLPNIDGFETCRRIRRFSEIPIIMLTARGDVMDRVVGLEIGADDYLPKPFEPRELVARIQNILKRAAPRLQNHVALQFESLSIDPVAQQVMVAHQPVELTSAEYRLLLLLAGNPNRIFSRDDIMQQLNGIDADIYSRAIDILISRLRHKLSPLRAIKTIRSRGYQFVLRRAEA